MPTHSLPDEAKAVIWRIFGSGESLRTNRSTYELIEPIIKKHISSTNVDRAVTEVRSWFEPHGDRHWLKSDMSEQVADLILEGIRTERSETAIWAVAWIASYLAARNIHSNWCPTEIDSLVEAVLTTLKQISDRDEVLDVSRCTRLTTQDSKNAKIPKSAVVCKGRLKTYRKIREYLLYGLHQAVSNLIELVVELQPEKFESLVEQLDHPVIQARAAHHMMIAPRCLDHRKSLQWIKEGSCDALVALSIVHTLNTINHLDLDLSAAGRLSTGQILWHTELRPPGDDLNAAATVLITDLADRLEVLDPLVRARWIGELLSYAPSVFHSQGNREVPRRIKELERACTALLARLVQQSWSDDLLDEFRAGLRRTLLTTWTRHLAEVAWEVRDVAPTQAAEIARVTLEVHEQQIARQLAANHLYVNWSHWDSHEWMKGLSVALVLSHEELDHPLRWVTEQCQALPLSVWDAEEGHEAFCSADKAAQHWFHVALGAIPLLRELGYAFDPAGVCALAEALWAHCHFVGKYIRGVPGSSIEAEYAARIAVAFGEPSDIWLLKQARNPGVGPRALWELLDQRMSKCAGEGGMYTHNDNKVVVIEVARLAAERFGSGAQFSLGALQWWGRLWLKLDAIDQAEQTARAILAFPLGFLGRAEKLLISKLLALVASKRELTSALADYPAWLYSQLWPSSYTGSEERMDREQIDALLRQSKSRSP